MDFTLALHIDPAALVSLALLAAAVLACYFLKDRPLRKANEELKEKCERLQTFYETHTQVL